uniref:Tyrosine--tRNA ligase, cytoplasmic (Trinotate prediction) n=1 Tax=Myxobolus squamalis TaxID=59785 RepID=A0A6B2FZW7_MYXSQ
MIVGEIKSIEQHPTHEKYKIFTVNIALNEPIIVCDCSDPSFSPDLMLKKIIVVTNTSPKIVGSIVSKALIIFIKNELNSKICDVEYLSPPDDCIPGDQIYFSTYPPKKNFTQIKIDDNILGMITNNTVVTENCSVEYLNGHLTSYKGLVKSNLKNGTLDFCPLSNIE